MEKLTDLIASNRSYRRFYQDERPSHGDILAMIEGARLSASAANLQRLLFTPVTDSEQCRGVFDTLAFAAYLGKWRPSADEAPTGYLVIWTKNEPDVNLAIDAGIAAQSALLVARSMGFGGCMFRSFDRERLLLALGKDSLVPVLVIALGKPSETVVITEPKDGSVKYYRDESGVHFVPKKPLSDIII